MFTKVEQQDLVGKGVVGQPSVPGLSVQEMQESVEQIVREVAIPALNRLVEELAQPQAAGNIGSSFPAPVGEGDSTVQDVLEAVAASLQEHREEQRNPHGVTAEQTGAYTRAETDERISARVTEIGSADMTQAVYDPQSRQTDIFAWSFAKSESDARYFLPAGSVMPYAGAQIPQGWLLCDGRTVGRSDYPALFAAIGVTYGSGDGSTTFRLPDLRGRVVAGTGAAPLAAAAGSDQKKITRQELPNERLQISDNGTWIVDSVQTGSVAGVRMTLAGRSGAANVCTEPMGSGQSFDVRQATLYLNYIIKC